MKKYLSPKHQDELIQKCVGFGDFTLASGARVSQKFDFDKLDTESELFKAVLRGLTLCVRDNFDGKFGGIVTVANGATRLGDSIGEELGVPHLRSSYKIDSSGQKIFTVHPEGGVRYEGLIAVDDVFTKGTNITKVQGAASQHGLELVGAAVVLDRSGMDQPITPVGLAIRSLIRRQLP